MTREEALKIAIGYVKELGEGGQRGAFSQHSPLEKRVEAVERFARFLMEDSRPRPPAYRTVADIDAGGPGTDDDDDDY